MFVPRDQPSVVSTPPLVGRGRERVLLLQMLDAVEQGTGSLMLVSGEAGIGKTTLVEDLAVQARSRDLLVLTGGCYDLTTTPPYGAWLDALSSYRPAPGMPVLPTDWGEAESQSALFSQLWSMLDELSRQVPLLLILEDLHWADPSSLDLLREIARNVRQSRVLLIATWRVDELDRRHPLYRLVPLLVREAGGVRIDLHRLDTGAHNALVAARYALSDVDRERLVTYLQQHAEGNPFFLTELLRSLEEEGLLSAEGSGRWRLEDLSSAPVPDLVRQVIETRVERLGGEARRLLEIASVIGYDVPLGLWTALSQIDLPALSSVIEQVVNARLLHARPPDHYRFSHELAREAIYDGIVLTRRRELHRRVADLLATQEDPHPDRVAHHLERAGDPRLTAWLLRAGERARQQFAPRVAIERFTAALASAERLSDLERIHAYLERGRAYETLGDLNSALADAEVALSLARAAGNWQLEWQTLLDLGAAWAPSDYGQSGSYYRQALDLARSSADAATLAVSLNRLGNWYFNVLRLDSALELHQEALGILESLGDLRNLAQTHDLLAMTWWANGDGYQAQEHWDTALRLFDQLGDRLLLASSSCTSNALSLVDFPVVAARPPDPAFSQVRRGLSLAREIEWRPGEVFGLHNLARLHLLAGDVDTCFRLLDDALALSGTIGHQEWSAANWWNVGLARHQIRDLDGAREAHERGLEIARSIGSLFFVRLSVPSLARVLIDQANLDMAERLLDTLDDPPGTLHGAHLHAARASLALARDDAASALDLVDTTLAALPNTDGGVVPELSLLRGRALRQLDRLEEAAQELVAARDWLTQFGERPERVRVCAELHHVCQQCGQTDLAQRAADECHEHAGFMLDHLSDRAMAKTFGDYVDALLSPRSGSNAAPAGLSTREIEVLRLVAEGLTDIEVARRLSLSRRTVSSHLRSIYLKLDVSTRTAATRLAIERGII